MNAEDRLRDAYRNLGERAANDIDPAWNQPSSIAGPPATTVTPLRSRMPGRPALVLAAAAVIVAAATAVALDRSGDGQEITTEPADTTAADDADDATGDEVRSGDRRSPSSGATSTAEGAEGGPSAGDEVGAGRYRVDTAAVAADTSDPFLNVRLEPDPGADLLAKLPADYTGLVATGRSELATDGGTWFEVELLDPVAVATVVQATGRPPAGWVNAAFVEALPQGLPVTTGEVPACAGGFDRIDTGAGLAGGYLYAMESGLVTDGCLRVVLTFGRGRAPFEWYDLPDGTGPAGGLPEVFTTMSGGIGASVELGAVGSAWPAATDSDRVYAVRRPDRALDLVTPLPVDGVTITGLPDRGIVVVDLELGQGSPPPSGAGVVLTEPVQASGGAVAAVGLARPFEGTLGVTIEDRSGDDVEALFSGSDFLGTVRSREYGVGATDWTEAWGMFAVRAEGLPAGDYTLVLDAGGGADDPATLRVPFTVDDTIGDGGDETEPASEAEQAAAMALVDFARGGDAERLPLADEVTLTLGSSQVRRHGRAELADPDAWTWDVDLFAGYSGPFNPLDQLQQNGLRFTGGPIPHCAGPAITWPAELRGLRQVNIEPVAIDSCLQWFGVHLFLDDQDRIAAVALDLWEP